MEKQTIELGPYFTQALGEMQGRIIALTAERDALGRQLHIANMELEALKADKKPKATAK